MTDSSAPIFVRGRVLASHSRDNNQFPSGKLIVSGRILRYLALWHLITRCARDQVCDSHPENVICIKLLGEVFGRKSSTKETGGKILLAITPLFCANVRMI